MLGFFFHKNILMLFLNAQPILDTVFTSGQIGGIVLHNIK